jgi:CspA family cold shock protein
MFLACLPSPHSQNNLDWIRLFLQRRDEMATGTVKWFRDNPQKSSFGFITPDDGTKDVFFAFNGVAGPRPTEGQRVEYTVETRTRGPIARDLKVLP